MKTLIASQDVLLEVPANYNDRLILKEYLQLIPVPDLVLIGGSRMMNLDQDLFSKEKSGKILNAGVSAGTIRDYIGVWQLLKEKKKVPSKIILCLDAQSFYSNREDGYWYFLSDLYLNFMRQHESFIFYIRHVIEIYFRKTVFNLKMLSSSQTTGRAIRSVLHKKSQSVCIKKDQKSENQIARTQAFALVLPHPKEDQKFVDHWAAENGRGEIIKLSDRKRLSDENFKEFSYLVHDITSHGVEIFILLMPAHPLSYEVIRRNPEGSNQLRRFIEKIEEISSRHQALFYDGINQYSKEVKNWDFFDGVHLKKEANYRFIKYSCKSLGLDLFE